MPEPPASAERFFADLLGGFADGPVTLPAIFQLGDRIAEAAAASIPAATPTQRIAVLGASTIDYLRRAVACAVLQEGVFPLLYQAPSAPVRQEILDPGSALHGFDAGCCGDRQPLAGHGRRRADGLHRGGGGSGAGTARGAANPVGHDGGAGAKVNIQHLIAPPPRPARRGGAPAARVARQ